MKYLYENLNTTELIELSKIHNFLSSHRGIDRETLIKVIEGQINPKDLLKDPIDEEREAMMQMKEDWKDVYNQLKCASEYYACWDCPPARARCCAVEECESGILKKIKSTN